MRNPAVKNHLQFIIKVYIMQYYFIYEAHFQCGNSLKKFIAPSSGASGPDIKEVGEYMVHVKVDPLPENYIPT